MFMNFKTSLLLVVLFLSSSMLAQEEKGPELTFEKEMHDYGVVFTDSMPDSKLQIKFSNTGEDPLIINNVTGCCGTKVNEWPKKPVMPGEEGVIDVEFRLAPRPQRISRVVTVISNAAENPRQRFRIVGQVKEREEGDEEDN